MIHEKSVIEKLKQQKSDYTSPESAQDQSNSLESLSADIYTDSKRFIYELLQNADDASSGIGNLEIQIKIIEQYLIISHQGEPFTEIDIESVCSVGDGNKKGDENKTGFKGIGFKSVFSHADCAIINSGDYCFKFDKSHWKDYWVATWGREREWKSERERKGKEANVKMPWQIIPIWTELPEYLAYLENFSVSTIIRYDNIEKIQKELFELFSNIQILLFLRSQEVKVSIIGIETLTVEKVKQDGIIRLKRNGQELSEWLLKSFTLDVDIATKNLIENDVRIPKKLRKSNKTEISFAVQLEKGKIKVADEGNRLIFTYLPTSVNYGFPFLVNASFLTDAGRQNLHEDLGWNTWLFNQIPIKLFIWLSELAQSKHKNQILGLVPNKLSNNSELKQSFNDGFTKAIGEIAFIPNKQGNLLKVSEAIFDKTNISEFLDPQILIAYVNSNKSKHFSNQALIPYFEPISTLSRLGVEIFAIEHLEGFFSSANFKEEHQLSENFKLILFLYEQAEQYPKGEEKNLWNQKLSGMSFLFDNNKTLKTPQQVYFPSVELSNDFGYEISIIHPNIMKEIESTRYVKYWLELLGVKEPTNISFIEKTIIGSKDYLTTKNAVSVGCYLFEAHKKGMLTNEHYDSLKSIRVLTTKNNLAQAQIAFLSNFYEPELKLESIYENDFYVSKEYYLESDLKSEWKTFFIKIGVNENIKVQEIIANSSSKLIEPEYFDYVCAEARDKATNANRHPHLIRQNNEIRFNRIAYTELANIYEFSKLFWIQVFVYVNLKNVGSNGKLLWGQYGSTWDVKNYFYWALENLSIFPTTTSKCLKAKDVFLNQTDIKQIAGTYLPIFDYEKNVPLEWLPLLPFKESLDLKDYLTILSAIWKDTSTDKDLQKENHSRTAQIYEKLAHNYLGYFNELKEWGTNNKLLAKDGKTFFYPCDLSVVVNVEGFKSSNLAYCDEKNEEVIKLLKLFGVSVIDKVTPYISNSRIEITDFKEKLAHILPLIAALSVQKSKSKRDWETEYNRLQVKLKDMHFFETTAIYLSYGNEVDKQKRSSWAEGSHFYYIGNWYKPRVLDSLIEPLGKFLGIHYASSHLSVLLSDTFKEGMEYLKEKFGEDALSIIPTDLLNPKEQTNSAPNEGNRAYNQSDEAVGRKGELFVFNELKKFYSKKYDVEIEETSTGFRVSEFVEVHWRNMIKNTNCDHDFLIKEIETEIYLDSKATPYDEYVEKVAFHVSAKEFILMESKPYYLIARVFNVTTNPSMKFIRLSIDNLGSRE